MKTLFVTYNGATEPLIRSQGIPYLAGLSRKGIKCTLLSFEKRLAGKADSTAVAEELRKAGIEWVRLRYHKSPSIPATIFDILVGTFTVLWLAVSRRMDVIHARASVPAVMGYIAARLTGKKFIFDERGLMAEEYADGGMWKRGGTLYRLVRAIEKRLILKADAVVVLTENIKRFLTDGDYLPCHPDKLNIHVIPCCVDLERFRISAEDKLRFREEIRAGLAGKFIFIYTGSLGTWYMLDEMIDFYSASRKIVEGAHLMVVTHIGQEAVKAAARKRGITEEDITVTGASFEDMPRYLNAADAGMFFIKPVLSKRSSCPIKFAEYLACGLPVVINAGIGDTAEVIRNSSTGVVIGGFSRNEYERAAADISALAKNNATARRCRETAAAVFSLDSGVGKYEKIYEGLKGGFI